jgi:hypothetical protein
MGRKGEVERSDFSFQGFFAWGETVSKEQRGYAASEENTA